MCAVSFECPLCGSLNQMTSSTFGSLLRRDIGVDKELISMEGLVVVCGIPALGTCCTYCIFNDVGKECFVGYHATKTRAGTLMRYAISFLDALCILEVGTWIHPSVLNMIVILLHHAIVSLQILHGQISVFFWIHWNADAEFRKNINLKNSKSNFNSRKGLKSSFNDSHLHWWISFSKFVKRGIGIRE